MNYNLSRTEKERLYGKKMTELQAIWGNEIPTEDDFDFPNWTDEQLDKGLDDVVGLLRWEKYWSWINFRSVATIIIGLFILLGVFGLLLFGIRQLF